MTETEFNQEIRAFLSTWRTMSLATVDAQGHAHAANLQFVADDQLCLYYVSSLSSAHSEHIVIDPRVAATIYAHTDEHTQIHGLQLHGRCEQVVDVTQKQRIWELYVNRFDFITGNPMFESFLRSEEFFKVTPTWLRWIDNRRSFGFKMEQTLSA